MRLPLPSVRRFALTAVLGAAAVAAACQDSKHDGNGSSLATLDNVAANAKLRGNECRGEEDAALPSGAFNAAKYAGRVMIPDARIVVEGVDAATAAKLKDEVKIALTAVPAYSQRLFDKLTGNVLVTTNAAKLCGAVISDPSKPQYMTPEAVDTIESCTLLIDRRSGATDGSDRTLALVIKATPDAIRHGLVRGFGYMHAQFFPRLRRNVGADSSALFSADTVDGADVLAFKDELTRSFLADMVGVGGKKKVFSAESLAYLVGPAPAGKTLDQVFAANLGSAGADADKVFDGLSMAAAGQPAATGAARAINIARVRDTLIANAYDSKYCRPHGSFNDVQAAAATKPADVAGFTNTERVFSTYFGATYTSFNEKVVPAFQQHAEAVIAVIDGRPAQQQNADATVASNPSAGFGLQGGGDVMTMLLPILMGVMQQSPARPANQVNLGQNPAMNQSAINAAMRAGQQQMAASGNSCANGSCVGGTCSGGSCCQSCGMCGGPGCTCDGGCGCGNCNFV
jgi:hypothetical protein